jgi:hypothetical protein
VHSVTPSCDCVVSVLLASVGLKCAGHVRSFLKSATRLSYMLKIGCVTTMPKDGHIFFFFFVKVLVLEFWNLFISELPQVLADSNCCV